MKLYDPRVGLDVESTTPALVVRHILVGLYDERRFAPGFDDEVGRLADIEEERMGRVSPLELGRR